MGAPAPSALAANPRAGVKGGARARDASTGLPNVARAVRESAAVSLGDARPRAVMPTRATSASRRRDMADATEGRGDECG